jgi:hypothetical protein
MISSTNRDHLAFFFHTHIPFISFSGFITLAKISNTMLNRSGDSRHPGLIPEFRGNAFWFFPFSVMLVIGLCKYSLYYIAVRSFYSYFFRTFIIKGCWILPKAFLHYRDDHVIFVLDFIYAVNYIYWSPYVEPFLYSWNKTNLIMLYDFFLFLTFIFK